MAYFSNTAKSFFTQSSLHMNTKEIFDLAQNPLLFFIFPAE